MNFRRLHPLVLLLAAGLLAASPGFAEGIVVLIPGGSCAADCISDTDDGDCGPSCDECECCARATMSAVFLPCPRLGAPGRIESAQPTTPSRVPLPLSNSVYHPPRT